MDSQTFDGKLKVFWKEFRERCLDGDRMYRYLSGELDPAATSAIEEHLNACSLCALKKEETLDGVEGGGTDGSR